MKIQAFNLLSTCLFAFSFVSCTSLHHVDRSPQSVAPSYDRQKVSLLKQAAAHKILFQVPDSLFQENASKSVESICNVVSDAAWVTEIYELLEYFEVNAKLKPYSKFHVIEFKLIDAPTAEAPQNRVEIRRDLDDVTYLVLSYYKTIDHREIKALADIPCERATMDLIGKNVVEISYHWPTREEIGSFLSAQKDKQKVPRFDYDSKFLDFLAERLMIFRMTPDLAAEISMDGQPLLKEVFKDLADKTMHTSTKSFDFWMDEISQKSKQGEKLKIFALKKDPELHYGVWVDSKSDLYSKMNGRFEITYPYISYRLDSGKFVFTSFEKLESCLTSMKTTSTTFDKSPQVYLFPGYHCPQL